MVVGLYLHFAYCRTRCTYCDFNAYSEPDAVDEQRGYFEALLEDVRRAGAERSYRIRTLFCGGGTPSLTPAAWMGELLEVCRTSFELEPLAEITLEANPGTVDQAYLTALRQAGFNRLSLGVQSFQDELLQRIGRIHSARQASQALAAARAAGFDNVSLDLIYGLPGQTLADFRADLEQVGELRPEHLSAYALTVEPNTRLEAQIRLGEVAPPDPDLQADMADLLAPSLRPLGYRRYEISNWALPGRACRHNLIYWRNRPYLGLGCGATSYIDGWRTRRILHPHYYAAALAQGRSPVIEHERLGLEGTLKDVITLALRTRRGLDLERLYRRYPVLPERVEGFLDGLPAGLVLRRGSRVRLTGRGRNIANVVFVELLETVLTHIPGAATNPAYNPAH